MKLMLQTYSFFDTTRIMAYDLTGQVFGYLTVLSRSGTSRGQILWKCLCSCGGTKDVAAYSLTSGATKSCGCYHKKATSDANKKHGHFGSPTYSTWASMIQRTTNENNPQFERYGAVGIGVCERWRTFENFLADMGERPKGLTLDRRNNDLGYSHENCRWATKKQQAANRGYCIYLTDGKTILTVADWAKKKGVARTTLYRNIHAGGHTKYGLTPCDPPAN